MASPKNLETLVVAVLSDLKRRAQITKPANEYTVSWDDAKEVLVLSGKYTPRTSIVIKMKCRAGHVNAVSYMSRVANSEALVFSGIADYIPADPTPKPQQSTKKTPAPKPVVKEVAPIVKPEEPLVDNPLPEKKSDE